MAGSWASLDGRLFTLLVLMAVIMTVPPSPALDLLEPDPWLGEGDVR